MKNKTNIRFLVSIVSFLLFLVNFLLLINGKILISGYWILPSLFKKFGSVQKISEARIDEIASISGINEELARKIKEQLNKN